MVSTRSIITAAALCSALTFGAEPAALAQGDARAASRKFSDAEKAYRAGDYARAGESFEAAYDAAPHADALWNAARAWQRAGEPVRAANLYARYLREAPPGAVDRNSATAALNQLSPKLGRIELHADDLDDVTVDGKVVDRSATLYVAPGKHVIRARRGERVAEQVETVQSGAVVSVAIAGLAGVEPPSTTAPPPSPSPPSAVDPPQKTVSVEPRSSGWSPVVVWIGGAITVAAAGAAVWSGLDTLSARDAFISSPSQDGLDDGKARQLRTNVLFAATGVAAVVTLASAIFFVDWRARPSKVEVGVGAGILAARGTF